MSKKLLIAVLSLGILISFSGFAIADDGLKVNNNAVVFDDTREGETPLEDNQTVQKPTVLSHIYASPATILPPYYFCEPVVDHGPDLLGWGDIGGNGWDYGWAKYSAYENYSCTLKTVNIALDCDNYLGTPDLVVVIFDDDWSWPIATEYGRVTVPWAELPQGTEPAWVSVDVSGLGLVFEDGDGFHVGVTVDDVSRAAGEYVALMVGASTATSDYAFRDYGNDWWGWFGPAYAFAINIDMCVAEYPDTDCYTQDWFSWPRTGGSWFADGWYDYRNCRFTCEGPETLKSVWVDVYYTETPEEVESFDRDIDVLVMGNDGGYADLSNIIYTATILGEDLNRDHTGNTVDLPEPYPVLRGDFNVAVSMNETTPGYGLVGGSSTPGPGTGRCGAYDWSVPEWYLSSWTYAITADLCADKYSICYTVYDACGTAYYWTLPDVYGDIGNYQKITSIGLGCRLEEVAIAYYGGDAPLFTHNSEFQVYDNDGPDGLPGTLLASIVVTPGEYVYFPDFIWIDFSSFDIRFDGSVWVGVESLSPTPEEGIRTLSDDGSCGNYRSAELWVGGGGYMNDDWGAGDINFKMKANLCCNPPPEQTCSETGDDWPAANHDFRRTKRSFTSSGDARCYQDLAWSYKDALSLSYGRGLISDGILVVPFAGAVRAWDLSAGTNTPIWEISGLMNGMGTGANSGVASADGKVVFANGNRNGATCVDLYTGAVVWIRGLSPAGFLDPNANGGHGAPVILDGVAYINDNMGVLYAWNMADGTDFWAPVELDGDIYTSLSSNGVDVIYAGTNGAYYEETDPLLGIGSFYAIDAATGGIIFQMQGDDWGTYRYDIDEGETTTEQWHRGGAVVDNNGDIYVRSDFAVESAGAPAAALYKLSSSGSIEWGVAAEYPSRGALLLDVNIVYTAQWSGWGDETGGLKAYSKINGNLQWDAALVNEGEIGELDAWEFYHTTNGWGAMDCQQLQRDLVYVPSGRTAGYGVYNGDNGELEIGYLLGGTSDYSSGVLIDDGHVVFQNRAGEIYVMENGMDEVARIRILDGDQYQPVPFLVGPGYAVDFEGVFSNVGCANLTGTITADEVAPVVSITSVNPSRISRAGHFADGMVDNSYLGMTKGLQVEEDNDDFDNSAYAKDSYSNNAAYAKPNWLTTWTETFDLADGDVFDMHITVDGDLVTRGAHDCFFTINSNATYFLNEPDFMPTVQLGVIGGCSASFDTIYWGDAETPQNYSIIYNNGMIAGDARNTGIQFWVDPGDEDYWVYFLGFLIFGQDAERIAWTSDSWGAAGNEQYETLLGDPNCAGLCISYVERNIPLGQVSFDNGQTYVDIMGEAVTYTYIDSVVDYGCNGDWDWTDQTCDYSNDLTMGMSFKCTEYGAYGVSELNNFLITRLEISNRNATPIVDPVYWAQHVDHDLGISYDQDTGGYDHGRFFFLDEYDVAWGGACDGGFEVNTNVAGSGTIGIPMKGVVTGNSLVLNNLDDTYSSLYDSVIYWCQNVDGAYFQPGLDPDPDGDGLNYDCSEYDPGDGTNPDMQATYLYDGFTLAAAGEEGDMVDIGMYRFLYSLDYETHVGYNTFDTALIVNTAKAAQQFAGFNRGDMNGDGVINLADVVHMYNYMNGTADGPKFRHLADVDASGEVDLGDVRYLADFCFCVGDAPVGEWVLPDICP